MPSASTQLSFKLFHLTQHTKHAYLHPLPLLIKIIYTNLISLANERFFEVRINLELRLFFLLLVYSNERMLILLLGPLALFLGTKV